MQHELVNAARVPKAHFGLRRMHVDVDAARIDLEEQQVTGLALAVQHLRVGFARGVRQHPVAHAAAVDEEVLCLGPRLRRSCVSEYTQRAGLRLDRQRGVDEFAQERSHALAQGLTAQMPAGAAIVLERERDFGARQRNAPEELVAVAEFGGFAAQELAARRRVEVQVGYRHCGARRACRGLDLADMRALGADRRAMRRLPRAGDDRDSRDRGDGSERLAAKSHAADAFQVPEAADLARGVARERERQVVARYAGAVVVDLDALRAALVQRHGDAARVRVEAVLEQLLQHRRGPLDYLAGSDLAHQEIGQDADRWHAKSI